MGGRGASYAKASGGGGGGASQEKEILNSLSSEERATVERYARYIAKDYQIYNPKNVEDVSKIEKAYDLEIARAKDIKNLKTPEHAEIGYLTKGMDFSNEDSYRYRNSSEMMHKIKETPTTVTYRTNHHGDKTMSKQKILENRVDRLKYNKKQTMTEMKTDALYKLAKKNKIKVTRKNGFMENRTAINKSGNSELINKAKKLGLWSL